MKLITLCLWRRPNYTQQVLAALSACVGIADYIVLAHLDGPPNADVLAACAQFTACPLLVMQSPQHIGCNASTFRVLNTAFALADYVIHDEDDVLLAPDALRYFEWARQFESDDKIMTVAAWRHDDGWLHQWGRPFPEGKNEHRHVKFMYNFHGWGWATWRSRWTDIRDNWTTGGDHDRSWDIVLCAYRNATGRGQLIPLVSRANNIGAELGTHRGASWMDYWAGSDGFTADYIYERV